MKKNGPPTESQFKNKKDFLDAMSKYIEDMLIFMKSIGKTEEDFFVEISKIPGIVVVKKEED